MVLFYSLLLFYSVFLGFRNKLIGGEYLVLGGIFWWFLEEVMGLVGDIVRGSERNRKRNWGGVDF